MGDSLNSNGRLGRAGALRAPGVGRAAAAIVISGLAVAGLVAAIVIPGVLDRSAAADDLARQTLVGTRSLTCQRVVVLLDQSGSMTQFAQVRTDAMSTLSAWVPENLRGNDQLAVIRWAARSETDLTATSIDSLDAAALTPGASDLGGETENVLLAAEQVEAMGPTSCRTALVFISDGELTTEVDSDALDRVLVNIGADQVSLVLPTSSAAPEYWAQLFPYSNSFHADPNDANQTARAVGQAIASATGQKLVVRP